MSEALINKLRVLRKRAQDLHASLIEDLRPFRQPNGTFRVLPSQPKDKGISVTTTCSVLMALVAGNQLDELYGKLRAHQILPVFRKVVATKWKSSGLEPDNPFTTSLVLRAAGFLKRDDVIDEPSNLRHEKQTLARIAKKLASRVPEEGLSVQQYPAKPAVGYWFVEGVHKLGITLDKEEWKDLAKWACREFENQLSYVVANDDALMDPVSLIMAACLAQRIRHACGSQPFSARITDLLPSDVELRCAITELFRSCCITQYKPLK